MVLSSSRCLLVSFCSVVRTSQLINSPTHSLIHPLARPILHASSLACANRPIFNALCFESKQALLCIKTDSVLIQSRKRKRLARHKRRICLLQEKDLLATRMYFCGEEKRCR